MSMRRGHLRRQASVDYPRYPPANSTTQQPPPETLAMLASDYESEAQDYTVEYPSSLPPINRTRDDLNLSVVQKHKSEVTAILSVASHATVYDWADTPTPGWQKSGVEGALFICQLTPGQFNEDRFEAFVLNRGGLENFEAELRQSESEGVEILQDLVIISQTQGGERKANGIYIFSGGMGTSTEHSRAANGKLMQDLAIAAQRSRIAAEQHVSEAHISQRSNGYPGQNATTYLQQPVTSSNRLPSPFSTRDADDTDENMLLKMFQRAADKQPALPPPGNDGAEALLQALRQPSLQPSASPAPQVAPVPTRKLDLLALFQGNQSDTEGGTRATDNAYTFPHQQMFPNIPVHPVPAQMNSQPRGNDLLNLFRGAGLA